MVVDQHGLVLLNEPQRVRTVIGKGEGGGSAGRRRFKPKPAWLGGLAPGRNNDEDPSSIGQRGAVGSNCRNGLSRERVPWFIDLDQPPAVAVVETLRQVDGRLQRRLGGGNDKDGRDGIGLGGTRRKCPDNQAERRKEESRCGIHGHYFTCRHSNAKRSSQILQASWS